MHIARVTLFVPCSHIFPAQAAYKTLPSSNVPPDDSAGGAGAASVLGRHASGLVQTLTSLIADDQVAAHHWESGYSRYSLRGDVVVDTCVGL